jgi:hypothetical protein
MKARSILFSGAFLFFLMMIGLPVRGADEKIFEGEIADSQCATNVHSLTRSHKEMIDMGSAGKTPADCANYCVKSRGGKYVLQTKQNMYKLDSQDLAEKSAGRKVKVTGTLDPKTNIIQVRSIDPLPSK